MYMGVLACVCKGYIWKDKRNCQQWLSSGGEHFYTFLIFVTIGIYYQFKFKMNWGENKNDYE